MDKITYLAELAEGLARWVPERERQDILRYYAEYFEEAGPGREAEVVQELGDPWALSCRLAVEGGFATQEQVNSWTPRRSRRRRWLAVAAVAAVVAIAVASAGTFALVSQITRNIISRGGVASYSEASVDLVEAVPGVVKDPVSSAAVGEVAYVSEGEVQSVTLVEDLDITGLDINVCVADVTITAGDGFCMMLTDDEEQHCHLKWELKKDGTLQVFDEGTHIHNPFPGAQRRCSMDVNITVPAGCELDRVKIEAGVGDIYVADQLVEKLTIQNGVGKVECVNPVAQEIDLESGTGNLLLLTDMETGQRIQMESGTGKVEFMGRPAPKMELGSGTGSVTATLEGQPREAYALELETGTGSIRVDGESYKSPYKATGNKTYRLDAESGTGSVTVDFIY